MGDNAILFGPAVIGLKTEFLVLIQFGGWVLQSNLSWLVPAQDQYAPDIIAGDPPIGSPAGLSVRQLLLYADRFRVLRHHR
jgi:hypothetical protein